MIDTTGVAELLAKLRGCKVIDLEQPRYFGAPTYVAHEPGYVYTLSRRHEPTGGRTGASGFIYMADHSGTHIDALSHQAWEMELHGGLAVTPEIQTSAGFTEQGIEEVSPIIRRGVLLDVARSRGVDRMGKEEVATVGDLESAAHDQGTQVVPGDVVLIRTGNGGIWDDPAAYGTGPGIDRGAAEWLAAKDVFAVGADNLALDVIGYEDPEIGVLPAHIVLIIRNGIFIMENLLLEELASGGHHEFLFLCFPLKLRGVTGSPIRPVALVPEEA